LKCYKINPYLLDYWSTLVWLQIIMDIRSFDL
jgi:hypothetical protein